MKFLSKLFNYFYFGQRFYNRTNIGIFTYKSEFSIGVPRYYQSGDLVYLLFKKPFAISKDASFAWIDYDLRIFNIYFTFTKKNNSSFIGFVSYI